MANERITEDMTDGLLRALAYYDDEDAILVEKQQSAIAEIRTALSKASKKVLARPLGTQNSLLQHPVRRTL